MFAKLASHRRLDVGAGMNKKTSGWQLPEYLALPSAAAEVVTAQ